MGISYKQTKLKVTLIVLIYASGFKARFNMKYVHHFFLNQTSPLSKNDKTRQKKKGKKKKKEARLQ